MYFAYSILLALGFLLMLPAFLLRREKYASGFKQRLGNYPDFSGDDRPVIWLHCVSVGEANAARPLVDAIKENFPGHRLVISTTTRTGQELAQKIFNDKADAIVYFPFDFKFAVRRALEKYKPSLVLLMETEIWPRFIREAKHSGAEIAIVNGRLSERSASRYRIVRPFISRVLNDIDLALMQDATDANRLISVGMAASDTIVTGNIKFDQTINSEPSNVASKLRDRFAIAEERPVIIAASTHDSEERWILEAFCSARNDQAEKARLMIVPRHPERFEAVFKLIGNFRYDPECELRGYSFARRSDPETETDRTADIILLDSIGELRDIYQIAEIVFVGGSLIPHGGQSVFEPAVAGKAMITGPYTDNFKAAVDGFLEHGAIRQTPVVPQDFQNPERLYEEFIDLLAHPEKRRVLGGNAARLMKANRGATAKTIIELRKLTSGVTEN